MASDTTFEIQVQDDHVERLSHTRKPILAVAELVWNALDADADRIDITLERDELEGLKAIVVADDGHGMDHEEAISLFSKLGGSWKKSRRYSREKKRLLHGQEGKGRLRSYSLGRAIDWTVRYKGADGLREFMISLIKDRPRHGQVSPDVIAPEGTSRGATVRISELHHEFRSLDGPDTINDLAMIFALYLRQYKSVRIFHNHDRTDQRGGLFGPVPLA